MKVPFRKVTSRAGLSDYLIRARSLHARDAAIQARFRSCDDPEFERFVDTEAILYYRELQEAGVPFPPSQEMLTVGGQTDLRQFLTIGYGCYRSVRRRFPESLPAKAKVLDFGVGCARTMRFFFRDQERFQCHGCDVDRRAVAYLESATPFIRARVIRDLPPMPYPAGLFDIVYSISVFSHLDQQALFAWLEEVHRVLGPEGTVILSLHGGTTFAMVEGDAARRELIGLSEEEFSSRAHLFHEGGFLWLRQPVGSSDIDASRYGISFIAREVFTSWTRPLYDLVEYAEGEIGGWQDLAVLRKARQG